MKTNEVEIKVRFSETDAMRVVYHGNFYSWFEVGRYHMVENFFPLSCKELGLGDFYMPVITSQCSYKQFVKFGETIVVRTYIVKSDTAKIAFHYDVLKKGSKKIIAKGYTEHVCLNSEYQMMIKLPDCINEDMADFIVNHPEYIVNNEKKR